jgi:hypothetical protein
MVRSVDMSTIHHIVCRGVTSQMRAGLIVQHAINSILVVLLLAVTAQAERAKCVSAFGSLGEAKLDQAVEMAWRDCRCDWKAPGRKAEEDARRAFIACVKGVARRLVASRTIPDECYLELAASAEKSTCGRVADGAVTCCVPTAERCIVTEPASTGSGRDRCLAMFGATLGGSASCYDACVPTGMVACTGEQDVMGAFHRAKERIASAQGKPFDITDPRQAGLLLLQTPHEYSCYETGRVTRDFGPDR